MLYFNKKKWTGYPHTGEWIEIWVFAYRKEYICTNELFALIFLPNFTWISHDNSWYTQRPVCEKPDFYPHTFTKKPHPIKKLLNKSIWISQNV